MCCKCFRPGQLTYSHESEKIEDIWQNRMDGTLTHGYIKVCLWKGQNSNAWNKIIEYTWEFLDTVPIGW